MLLDVSMPGGMGGRELTRLLRGGGGGRGKGEEKGEDAGRAHMARLQPDG